MAFLSNQRFTFHSHAFDEDKFSVVNMEGFEAISQPFRFTLTLVSADAEIDFDKILRHPAEFNIYAADGSKAVPYHGMIAEFDQLHRANGYIFYRAVLVPRLWQLSLYRLSEVYLNEQTIPNIIEKVLQDGRLSVSDYELRLRGEYRPRSFVCQYQETHLDFLSRWMEKEGMYYYFDHSGGADNLVVLDHRTMHAAQIASVNYRPVDELDTGQESNSVQGFVCRQKPLPHQIILQDFNHRKAAVSLKVKQLVSENGIGEVMLYGENFRDEHEGKRYAGLRAEEIICGSKVYTGESSVVGLRSGYFMQLAHHYRTDFNGKYLVTEIHHQGSQAGALLDEKTSELSSKGREIFYRNSFRAIPEAVQFRAQRLTTKPRVSGTMNAIVDAEGSGEYAELDEHGQYKVRLPFDQHDKPANQGSARVRMATPYSGSDHGMHFPLHKNAEVLLSFIDGDPDQPMIVAAVPNSENRSIVNQANPHENRISTKGGNQIFMGDGKGKEVMWLHSPFHNSSIGIGSIDPKGGGSIWTSTGGSSESVTVGSSNSVFGGVKNSFSVSMDNAFSAGVSYSMSLGASVGFGAGHTVAWKIGKNYVVDESTSVSLLEDAQNLANNELWLAGGQSASVKARIDVLKSRIKKVVIANTVINFLMAGGAIAAIKGAKTMVSDDEVSPEKVNFNESKTWSAANLSLLGAQAGLASMVAVPSHILLWTAASTIAKIVADKKNNYASHLKLNKVEAALSAGFDTGYGSDLTLNRLGATLTAFPSATLPPSGPYENHASTLNLYNEGVNFRSTTSSSKAEMTMCNGALKMNGTKAVSLADPGSTVLLDSTGIQMENPGGKINIGMTPVQGMTLAATDTVKMVVSATEIKMTHGTNQVQLNVSGINVNSTTRLVLNGQVIQLG